MGHLDTESICKMFAVKQMKCTVTCTTVSTYGSHVQANKHLGRKRLGDDDDDVQFFMSCVVLLSNMNQRYILGAFRPNVKRIFTSC